MTPWAAARTRRTFATAAMVLVVLYAVIDIVLQALPPHYSVVTDAESDLAVGPFGWVMRVNFAARAVMSGCLVAAVALAPRQSGPRQPVARPSRARPAGAVLLAVAGLCSAALVFFPTDINRAGEFGMTPRTATGYAHVLFATTGFVAVLVAMALLTRWMGRPALPSAFFVVALAGLVLLALSLAAVPQAAGLTERLCLVGILGWAFAAGLRLRRTRALRSG
jgi:hypothetical membrane protein